VPRGHARFRFPLDLLLYDSTMSHYTTVSCISLMRDGVKPLSPEMSGGGRSIRAPPERERREAGEQSLVRTRREKSMMTSGTYRTLGLSTALADSPLARCFFLCFQYMTGLPTYSAGKGW
jgi:hypothetical protein